jgi:hypothetical protein
MYTTQHNNKKNALIFLKRSNTKAKISKYINKLGAGIASSIGDSEAVQFENCLFIYKQKQPKKFKQQKQNKTKIEFLMRR